MANKDDLKKFDQFKKNVLNTKTVVVGVLGSNADKTHGESSTTNAEIALTHEMGSFSNKIPRRSFLKDPIDFRINRIIDKTQELINKYITEQGGAEKILTLIGLEGEAIVQEAFETSGYGQWSSLSPSTIEAKKSSAILIDTSQLRSSVTSETRDRKDKD